ncbi:hypothetical protein V8F20_002566 [Naviculisporaceae sp. PSN 640]
MVMRSSELAQLEASTDKPHITLPLRTQPSRFSLVLSSSSIETRWKTERTISSRSDYKSRHSVYNSLTRPTRKQHPKKKKIKTMASTTVDTHGGAPPASSTPAFIPLEANPELMTTLIHNLGVSPALSIHDVYSLTDPDLLSFIPRPALALLLVFPVSATYESHRLSEDAIQPLYAGSGPNEPVLWFRQTIRNACGLMGLLHATANGPARNFITEGSDLDKLVKEAVDLDPVQRAKLLETSESLARAHREAATRGDTTAPEATDDVDLHYVCFVKTEDGTLWELDGRRKGPLKRGTLESSEDVLSPNALALGPLKFLEREGGDLRFSCVALAGSLD